MLDLERILQQDRLLRALTGLNRKAFAGVKRYNAVTALYGNRVTDFDDRLMLIAAGLWNFYLAAG